MAGLAQSSPATQRSYVHAVSKFSRFFGRSPETLTLEDVRYLSGPPRVEGRGMGEPQPDGGGAAVLLWRYARTGGGPGAHPLRPRTPASAGGAERRRGGAVSRIRADPEGPRCPRVPQRDERPDRAYRGGIQRRLPQDEDLYAMFYLCKATIPHMAPESLRSSPKKSELGKVVPLTHAGDQDNPPIFVTRIGLAGRVD